MKAHDHRYDAYDHAEIVRARRDAAAQGNDVHGQNSLRDARTVLSTTGAQGPAPTLWFGPKLLGVSSRPLIRTPA